jgi:hypothetical protein
MEHPMPSLLKIAAIAGSLVATSATIAPAGQRDEQVPERQPVVTQLGADASAMTFWVVEPDGWRVVTIVDTAIGQGSDAERHAVVRFSSVLLPGQSQLISVPLALGEPQQLLRITRVGDRILAAEVVGGAS